MSTEHRRLIERRDLVVNDLEELANQVAEGEIDATTFGELRATYKAELDGLDKAIEALGEPVPEPAATAAPPDDTARPATRSPRRVVIGSVVVMAALTTAIALAARDTSPDNPGPSAGSPGALTVDPETVSNEQLEAVVAANPDIIGMRMALADRYFAAEQFGSALDHYLYIADADASPSEESRALARLGWMAYATGLGQAAEEFIVASLEADPTNAEAVLFRGFITLYGLGDAERAIPQLEEALQLDGLSPGNVSELETALEDARSGES